MIRHIVMFKLKDSKGKTAIENANEAKLRFDNVLKNVPQILKGELVINSDKAPQDNYTIALICDFETIDELNTYQVHPAHVEFSKFIGKIKDTRACIDLEI